MIVADGFTLAAIMAREDPRDAFVSNKHKTIASLAPGSVVGTSSLRREAQLRERFPHPGDQAAARQRQHTRAQARRRAVRGDHPRCRGSQATRLRRTHQRNCSIPRTVCRRSGRVHWPSNADRIAPTSSRVLGALADRQTTLAVAAERAFGMKLAGDCHTPLAAFATTRGDELWLRGLIASRDGTRGPARRARDARHDDRNGRRARRGARRRIPRARRGEDPRQHDITGAPGWSRHPDHAPGPSGRRICAPGGGDRWLPRHLSGDRHPAPGRPQLRSIGRSVNWRATISPCSSAPMRSNTASAIPRRGPRV